MSGTMTIYRRDMACRTYEQELAYYHRLCQIQDGSAAYNAIGAVSIIREGLHFSAPGLEATLSHIHQSMPAPMTSMVLVKETGIRHTIVASNLRRLWKDLLLMRARQNLPQGGREFCYTLSPLGQAVMQVKVEE